VSVLDFAIIFGYEAEAKNMYLASLIFDKEAFDVGPNLTETL
jgi:hypothetical protein